VKISDAPFDGILDSFSTNKNIESLKISMENITPWKLNNSNSLRFIEQNSTLKTLSLQYFQFDEIEMKILNDSLMGNNSLKDLDLSFSNFQGPFKFLKNNNLNNFTFMETWSSLESIHFLDFCAHLKSNSSLIHLNLSKIQFFINSFELVHGKIQCENYSRVRRTC
jgi:hypothetical protein